MVTLLEQLLAKQGRTIADLPTTGVLGRANREAGVHRCSEFERVAALPRRAPITDAEIDALSRHLGGALRPAQAEALKELFECRGLFAPMRVGSGKTLVTLLAPTLLHAKRPVLLVPANLREKTKRDFAEYSSQGWRVRLPKIISYQALGLPKNERLLEDEAPDLLLLDEAHYTRNLNAACSRRVARYIEAHRPVVAALSGTLITPSLMDYQHHAVWSLGERAPLPLNPETAATWAQALDRDIGLLRRRGTGALDELPGGFHEHFRTSRGVVPTPGGDCDASITISWWKPELPKALREVIERTAVSGLRPDGEMLDENEIVDCLCRLALGHYTVWDPMPPDWWLDPRRGWFAYARAILEERIPGYDSLGQVADNPPHPAGRELLDGWLAVRDAFKPNPVAVWVDDSPLRQAAKAAARSCLIWTRYRAVGERLAALGVPYFGAGTNPEGARGTIAVSIQAHGTGKNLQHGWHRNLLLTPMANASAYEQLLGRTHRKGQPEDNVEVLLPDIIPYHRDVIRRVRAEARATTRATGFEQKLCIADWAD